MFNKRRSEVLVVGAGPVGLYTALRLSASGVDVQIVDKDRRTGAHSYALALHARSLRMLDGDGLAAGLLGVGHRIESLRVYRDQRECARLSLADEPGDPLGCVLVLPQSVLERVLEEQLERLKVRVLWNHRLEQFAEAGEGIEAEVSKLDRVASGYPIARVEWEVVKRLALQSRFLVGADGYHSTVRRRLPVEFPRLGPFESFSVFEFETAEPPGHDVHVLFDGERTSALWPISDTRCRFSFGIADPAEHESSLERLNALIQERAPWFPAARGELHWSSMVQFDRRLAAGMGRGRTWLAGDAVHVTGPIGVQSMNAGLVDAYELAGHLTQVLRHDKPAALLDSYVAERMRELRPLFGGEPAAVEADDAPAWAVGVAPRLMSAIPATGRDLDALCARSGAFA